MFLVLPKIFRSPTYKLFYEEKKNKVILWPKSVKKNQCCVVIRDKQIFLVWNSVHKVYLKIILYLKGPLSLCSHTQPVN